MNGDINDMLKNVLQNPEALSGVMKIAQGMMNGKDANTDSKNESPQWKNEIDNGGNSADGIRADISNLPLSFAHDEDRVQLLKALRPYLGEKRRKKIDNIISMMSLLKLFSEKG